MKIHTFIITAIVLLQACTPKENPNGGKFNWPTNFHVELDSAETLLYMQGFSDPINTGHNLVLETWSNDSGKFLLQSRLRARRAVWDSIGARWHLQDVYLVQNYDALEEKATKFQSLDTALGFTPTDLKLKITAQRRAR